MSRIFLDANILLEILFSRKLSNKCEALVSGPNNTYAISALTIHIVWYMAERYKLPTAPVDDLLSVWEVLSVTDKTIEAARKRYDGKDFEDCLQAICAEAGNCNEIITIDSKFKEHSNTNLPVMTLK
jgi:predicted nucleic acid-binding protein